MIEMNWSQIATLETNMNWSQFVTSSLGIANCDTMSF
jgi:hypothetical protein